MLVTKVTSELPLVEDTIDTTRHDAEEQIPVAESALKELACHRAYQARSHSHAVQELVLQLWQVAVQTILTARPAVTLALRASSVTSCFSRVACTANPGRTIFNIVDQESQAMAAALSGKAATAVRFFLAIFGFWRRSEVRGLLRADQEVPVTLVLVEAQARRKGAFARGESRHH